MSACASPAKRRGKTAGIPFRQIRAPASVAVLTAATADAVAQIVQSRVASVTRARGCCCFVFVRAGRVYVMSEESAMARVWAVQRTSEWVGCYGGMPDIAALVEDLREMLPVR